MVVQLTALPGMDAVKEDPAKPLAAGPVGLEPVPKARRAQGERGVFAHAEVHPLECTIFQGTNSI